MQCPHEMLPFGHSRLIGIDELLIWIFELVSSFNKSSFVQSFNECGEVSDIKAMHIACLVNDLKGIDFGCGRSEKNRSECQCGGGRVNSTIGLI